MPVHKNQEPLEEARHVEEMKSRLDILYLKTHLPQNNTLHTLKKVRVN